MTTLTPTEQLVFALEKEHAAMQKFLEDKLKNAVNLAATLADAEVELKHTIFRQEATIEEQEAIMAQQDKQIQRIKPTLFGAYIGGLVSGAILATVIGAYILWVQG